MSISAVTDTGLNTIEGVDELSMKIVDINTVNALAEQVFDLGEQAAKITTIHVDISSYLDTLPGPSPFSGIDFKSLSTDKYPLCEPLVAIINFIKSHNGGLKSFTWPAGSNTDKKFDRPPTFWKALYTHTKTLETLHVGFFCHEVHSLNPLPTGTCFPALKSLSIDVREAHGDKGSTIEALLHASPNVEVLLFVWSFCDLDSCQIQNITWTWTFPKLWQLYVSGNNSAPAAYIDFLVRHPGIKSLDENLDGPYTSEHNGNFMPVKVKLPVNALPNLRELSKKELYTHSLRDYFNSAADRPIDTLALTETMIHGAHQVLIDIASLSTIQNNLRTLVLAYDIKQWRRKYSGDDSCDESEDKLVERATWHEQYMQHRFHNLEKLLTSLPNLQQLTIDFHSKDYLRHQAGAWVHSEPMGMSELVATLSHLPKSNASKLKTLRLKDPRAKVDAIEGLEVYLEEQRLIHGGREHVTGSLEVLEWCGEEKMKVFRFE